MGIIKRNSPYRADRTVSIADLGYRKAVRAAAIELARRCTVVISISIQVVVDLRLADHTYHTDLRHIDKSAPQLRSFVRSVILP